MPWGYRIDGQARVDGSLQWFSKVNMQTRKATRSKVIRLSENALGPDEIVAGLRKRDRQAAHAFYERYEKRINRVVWRMLGADPEHGDVVQQVFANILSSVQSLRDPQALDSWVTGVCANTVRRELRARKYRRFLHPAMDRPADAYCRDETGQGVVVQRVYELLRRLKAEHQVVLTLRYIEGLTLGELAAACDCSLATVKRRLARARRIFVKRAGADAVLSAWQQEARFGD